MNCRIHIQQARSVSSEYPRARTAFARRCSSFLGGCAVAVTRSAKAGKIPGTAPETGGIPLADRESGILLMKRRDGLQRWLAECAGGALEIRM